MELWGWGCSGVGRGKLWGCDGEALGLEGGSARVRRKEDLGLGGGGLGLGMLWGWEGVREALS